MKLSGRNVAFSRFSQILLKWNKDENRRKMPWKGEKDPYRIWLSEIILQQTRVEQGLKYYESFVREFPNIEVLANAQDQKIFKYWEGLGYYTRCRNLIKTARFVARDLKGRFPKNFEAIKNLAGIGPYTAAAIASFAFNEPHAVVDGNVYRVLARIFGIDVPIDTLKGKKYFNDVAQQLLDKKAAGIYNQAIMDFGATVCKPAPECSNCPFKKYCAAFRTDTVLYLPVKSKRISIRKRWFHYIIIEHNGKWAIRQRTGKDIWNSLFEFFLIESDSDLDKEGLIKRLEKNEWFNKKKFEVTSFSKVLKQQLSHQLVQGRFMNVKSDQKPRLPGVIWVRKSEMNQYAFPNFINQYVSNLEAEHK